MGAWMTQFKFKYSCVLSVCHLYTSTSMPRVSQRSNNKVSSISGSRVLSAGPHFAVWFKILYSGQRCYIILTTFTLIKIWFSPQNSQSILFQDTDNRSTCYSCVWECIVWLSAYQSVANFELDPQMDFQPKARYVRNFTPWVRTTFDGFTTWWGWNWSCENWHFRSLVTPKP